MTDEIMVSAKARPLLILGVFLISTLSGQMASPAIASVSFDSAWGQFGHNDGEISAPYGIAIGLSGNVYIADSPNHRIQKFMPDGTFISNWGSFGSNQGQFDNPRGIDVDDEGNVYVAEYGNSRIQKFDSDGTFITDWGSDGPGNGQFDNPEAVAVSPSGDVYVADTYNHRVQKFDSSGGFITRWGTSSSEDGYFFFPHGIEIDASGFVYVTDDWNNRLQKFTSGGAFVTKWGSSFGNEGSENGQFSNPRGVAINSNEDIFVVDTDNHRVQQFTSEGIFIVAWGSQGSEQGQFETSTDVAVDSSDIVYVVDSLNYRIQKFVVTPDTPVNPAPDDPQPIAQPTPTMPVIPTPGDPGSGNGTTYSIKLTSPKLRTTGTNWLSKKKLYRILRKGFKGTVKGKSLPRGSFSASLVRRVKIRNRKIRCYTLLGRHTSCKKTNRRGFSIKRNASKTKFKFRPYRPKILRRLKRMNGISRGTYILTITASSEGSNKKATFKIKVR